ncbi:MAG: hypothetical protein P4L51_19415 [Puia sp.]|nr:hypothetical protein [Puia sp.]
MRRPIGKILFVGLWCVIGTGVGILLVAAIKSKNSKTCTGWKISISTASEKAFVDRKEVLDLLTSGGMRKITGRSVMSFDLRQMEAELKRNVWIREAQLFFDNNQVLQVNVTERQPVARIFTRLGSSFLMDSSGVQIPLSDKFPARVPVFTGYPDATIRVHGPDSVLTSQIRRLSAYILSQPFWMSQLSQIDITPGRTFEMIPVVGNHLIEFGDGDDYEQKFHRLFIFYKEVLSKTGFDKYSKIDVEFDGQVIGTKKGAAISRYDSLQAIRNIQQLIMTARQLQADTVSRQDTRPLERSTMTEQTLTNYDLVPEDDSVRRSAPGRTPETRPKRPVSGNNHPSVVTRKRGKDK